MELLQLKYLCTAARFENFSRAAKHHNIPQSAISKTIAQLERELGTQLFLRNGNRVQLSESGRRFCREVQVALDRLDDAVMRVREGDLSLQGEVRLLVEEHSGEVLRAVADFRRAHPGVSFSIATPSDSPVPYDYDLRVCALARVGDHLGKDPLRQAEVFLLISATHRLAAWEHVPLTALDGERLILSSRNALPYLTAKEKLEAAGVVLPVAIECGDSGAFRAYVGSGAGVAFATGLTEREAGEAGIRLCRLQDTPLRYPTCLAYRRPLSPVAEAFRAELLDRLRAKG